MKNTRYNAVARKSCREARQRVCAVCVCSNEAPVKGRALRAMWRRRCRASKWTRNLGEKNRGCPRLLGDGRAVYSQPPSQQRAVCTEQCTLSLFGSSICAQKVNRVADWLFRTRMAPQIVCLNYWGQKNKFRRWNQFDIYNSSAETPTPAKKIGQGCKGVLHSPVALHVAAMCGYHRACNLDSVTLSISTVLHKFISLECCPQQSFHRDSASATAYQLRSRPRHSILCTGSTGRHK